MKISVKTGFGYYKDSQDRIICKAQLPKGEHPLQAGFTYHEVGSQAELDQIQVWRDPELIEDEFNESKIIKKQRELAITALKAEGQLPPDFVDAKV